MRYLVFAWYGSFRIQIPDHVPTVWPKQTKAFRASNTGSLSFRRFCGCFVEFIRNVRSCARLIRALMARSLCPHLFERVSAVLPTPDPLYNCRDWLSQYSSFQSLLQLITLPVLYSLNLANHGFQNNLQYLRTSSHCLPATFHWTLEDSTEGPELPPTTSSTKDKNQHNGEIYMRAPD